MEENREKRTRRSAAGLVAAGLSAVAASVVFAFTPQPEQPRIVKRGEVLWLVATAVWIVATLAILVVARFAEA